ncbi:alpha-D-glucose phosphate-specific phosphoglucomutase [Bradyrhizobium sp. LM6.9]
MADVHPAAGKQASPDALTNIPRLVTAYFAGKPDVADPAQRVAFGTSGHRGTSFKNSFNEGHILATTQAICDYRREKGLTGPLFIGIDTHALAEPALVSAVEVFAANGVDIMIDKDGGYTPTPVISHAILTYNKGRTSGLADGVVVTPSHNPPEDGGYKYNPPHGGPADTDATSVVEKRANGYLADGLKGVNRIDYARARKAANVHAYDFITPYVADLGNVVDLDLVKSAGINIGIDPLGGAAVHYWHPIIERYGLKASVVNEAIDPTFRFMTVDWDGKIRMDCSSPYAMASLIAMRDRFDVAFANDTDADRHGIVTRTGGLMNPNHYLATAISYLFAHRPNWGKDAAIGKTVVSSSIINRVAKKLGRKLVETPVGFQMVRRRAPHGRLRLWRRGECRGLVPAPRRHGVDHRQGRHHPRPARRRDHGEDRPRSEPALQRPHRRAGRAPLRAYRRRRHHAAEKHPEVRHARAARPEGSRR